MAIQNNSIISFPRGIIGFQDEQKYLLHPTLNPNFQILKAYNKPHQFFVCDPKTFFPNYNPSPHIQDLAEIGIKDLEGSLVLAILNKRSEGLTVNLRSPILVNETLLIGKQIILPQSEYDMAHFLNSTPNQQLSTAK